MRHLAPALLAVSVLLLGPSCTPTRRSCTLHSDCSEVERCVSGSCAVVCRTDRDCEGKGGRCLQGECAGESDGGATDSDAGTGGGTGGATGGGTGGAMGGGAGGGTGGGSTGGGLGGGTGGGNTGGGTGGGAGTGRYGALCSKGSDCLSGYCVANVVLGVSICTMECPSEAVCNPGHACLTVAKPGGGTVNVCVPSDSGQPCATGQGTSCEAGICLVHPTDVTKSECATPCDSSRACPTDFSCSLVNTGAGTQRLCTRVAAACTAKGTSTECITRWCSVRALVPGDGICTNNCRTAADCPAGWACDLENDTPSTLINSCHPVGEACTSNGTANDCYSGSCALTATSTGYCAAFCMNSSFVPEPPRCPQGWNCNPTVLGVDTVYVCAHP